MRGQGKTALVATLVMATAWTTAAMGQEGVQDAPAPATDVASAEVAEPGADAETPKGSGPRPIFIRRSIVRAPESLGPWQLQEAKGFVGQPELGYALIYHHHEHPEVLASLYVYPAGRVDPDQALEQQVGEIRRSLEYFVEQGDYDQARFGKVRRFDLPLADDDPVRQAALEAQRKADLIREELEAAGGDTPARVRFRMPDSIPGRRMDARVVREGVPYESRGYVLYRSLYYYKGRFTAPRAAVSPRQLDRLAEEAMALAASRITVDSTGSCADSTIDLNPEGELTAQLVGGVLGQEIRREAERCREKLDESVPEGYRLLSLEFLPDHWK